MGRATRVLCHPLSVRWTSRFPRAARGGRGAERRGQVDPGRDPGRLLAMSGRLHHLVRRADGAVVRRRPPHRGRAWSARTPTSSTPRWPTICASGGATPPTTSCATCSSGSGWPTWLGDLPRGLATEVGTHGARLSGGQRQRLAVARALLADFPVLVLDEPAEHLEPAAADALTADLLDVTDGRSLVLVTHRLVGLESVDEILVMECGRVVERGHPRRAARPGGALLRPLVGGDEDRALRPIARRNTSAWPATIDDRPLRGRPERREPHLMTTDLARWQFATTSIYHFLFVPVTIGLAFLVALLQTSWYRNDNPTFKRLTKFFGTLLLINVAVGVVTGSGPGVRVRDELVELLPLRRQHLRRPAGHGGSGGLLPRVHLPGHLDLRVGPSLEEAAPDLHLARGGSLHAVGPVHHGGQLVDAAPGRAT